MDTSVALTWGIPDEHDEQAAASLEFVGRHGGLAPALWPFEVANAILSAAKAGRLLATTTARFYELVIHGPIRIEPVQTEHVLVAVAALARETGLTVYDASYLDVAMRHDLKLATHDRALRAAAVKVNVPLFFE